MISSLLSLGRSRCHAPSLPKALELHQEERLSGQEEEDHDQRRRLTKAGV